MESRSICILEHMLKYYLELNNLKNELNLNNFGYLKSILMIENIAYHLPNTSSIS